MLCHSFNAACIKLAEQTEDESLKDMAEHAATFYAIPYYLLTNKTLTVPSKYETEYQEEIEELIVKAGDITNRLYECMDKDAKAFKPLSEAYGLPKDTEEQLEHRNKVMENDFAYCK